MKEKDVPQKTAISDEWHRITYAQGESGEYVLVESTGCDPVNITNAQAWEVVERHVTAVRHQVEAGIASPLAYHMVVRQMDEALLSQYTPFFKWQIKRHMKSKVFKKLNQKKLKIYADVFEMRVDELICLPKSDPKVES